MKLHITKVSDFRYVVEVDEEGTLDAQYPIIARFPITKSVVVPHPPRLHLSPRSERAVVTVAVGDECQGLLTITRPFMEAYARRLMADFVVLDWPGHPNWRISSKFAIARVLDHYERIAFVDADVLLPPGCIDLFAQCGSHEFGFVDETAVHRRQPWHGTLQEYARFRRVMGFNNVDPAWYGNCGVMVVPQTHKHVLLPPMNAIETDRLAEQHHTNAMLHDSGLLFRLLDSRCNWMWWVDPGFRNAPPDAVLHFACAGERRLELLREWAGKSDSSSDRA